MICPGCRRENDPRRRYCGKCGCNFSPVCRRCSFPNEHDDRFCGGCGANLIAKDGCYLRRAAQPDREAIGPAMAALPAMAAMAAMPAIAPRDPSRDAAARLEVAAVMQTAMTELSGLFASPATVTEGTALPDAGIAQDDLDRLFGVAL